MFHSKLVHLFELVAGGSYRAPVEVSGLSDPLVRERLDDRSYAKLCEELEMLDHAGAQFSAADVLTGELTPVFFGSARNNFGVQLLLDGFLLHAGSPRARFSKGVEVPLDLESFSGFIFKIQANMDPRHRDRIAFVRVCSGKFERDMLVTHSRSGKKVRLGNSSKLFGRDRETVDEAYPGDIVGFVGHQSFGIGDTLAEDENIVFDEIPHFPPEVFASLSNPNPASFKKFREGLDQLLQEGVVQGLQRINAAQRVPLLAAVGPLQFEVVQYRLESEYGAVSKLEPTEWKMMRWFDPKTDRVALLKCNLPSGSEFAENAQGQVVVLFKNEWALNYFIDKNPTIPVYELPQKRLNPENSSSR
jgi:peptide chain release factor 3